MAIKSLFGSNFKPFKSTVVWLCIFVCNLSLGNGLSPIILVPGDGGSEIQAKFHNVSATSVFCYTSTDTFVPVWLNLELITPLTLHCLVQYLKLDYNNVTHKTEDSKGVEIKIPGFGSTETVEWLDSSHFYDTSYYHDIADALVTKGYKRNVNLRGVPYDFRKAASEMSQLIDDYAALVEETYRMNNNSKVILLGHSMGCAVTGYMLGRKPQAWKDKYIKSFIAMAGPWGGSVKTFRVMASGDNLGLFVLNPLTARPFQQSMPSTAWLMPSPEFWNDTEVLVSGPKGNYTVKDYLRFFRDIDFETGYQMYKDNVGFVFNNPPGVEVHCLHGVNVSTPAGFTYSDKQWHDSQPTVIPGPGDGTVNLRSLHGCLDWVGKNKGKPVHHKEFSKAEHLSMLQNAEVISTIKNILGF